jgi:hypothetical protein
LLIHLLLPLMPVLRLKGPKVRLKIENFKYEIET